MAVNKACGPDLIVAEHLKNASQLILVLLALCLTGFLLHGLLPQSMLTVLLVPVIKDKTGKISNLENYRPIALANIISKVFEHILMDRLKEYLVTTDNQFGFKKKHGIDLCIYSEVVSVYNRHNSTVFMCFLDASKAFDRIITLSVYELQDRGVPPYLIRILQYWYIHQPIQVRWGRNVSAPFYVTNGVRQGGILSPLLFNLYMDDLSVEVNECKTGCVIGDSLINHLMYADDLVILSPYSSGLQQLLRVCLNYGVQHDIVFNTKKSVVMIVKTKEDRKQEFTSFYLGDQVLNVVNKIHFWVTLLEMI